jgi:hypothetical protein
MTFRHHNHHRSVRLSREGDHKSSSSFEHLRVKGACIAPQHTTLTISCEQQPPIRGTTVAPFRHLCHWCQLSSSRDRGMILSPVDQFSVKPLFRFADRTVCGAALTVEGGLVRRRQICQIRILWCGRSAAAKPRRLARKEKHVPANPRSKQRCWRRVSGFAPGSAILRRAVDERQLP